ncbi:MAG: hypothetical protein EBY17_26465, partial [Acidobacteriia bacterium]|nr:hypothetical protein [Terriglobia bacterium]
MTGAESLLRTLVTNGVDTCFMNPGTSEMHFVAALDRVPGMRGVLCLFEGVCSGAADGYARVLGQPASTLLHLGPGLANGLANFHNARKARSPIVNIVGEHATPHLAVDAPLSADIATFAKTVSGFVRTATSADDIGQATAETILAAWGPPGVVASLIIPADYSWSEAMLGGPVVVPKIRTMPDFGRLEKAAELLRKPGTAILLGGAASNQKALEAGARLAAATGVKVEQLGPMAARCDEIERNLETKLANTNEILEAYTRILREFKLNRVDAERYKRVQDTIHEPLRKITLVEFPATSRAIDSFRKALEDSSLTLDKRVEASRTALAESRSQFKKLL